MRRGFATLAGFHRHEPGNGDHVDLFHPMLTKPTASALIRPFYPALDGIRAIAFLMVFANHYGNMACNWQIFEWGWTGVDLFFVLSGFLITGILYDSLHRSDYFRNFYIRRALRIFPLFYGFWIVILLLVPVLHFTLNRYNLAMAAYVGNFFLSGLIVARKLQLFHLAYGSLHHPGHYSYISITPLWSLCVEEQFYLVWPAVIYFVRSRKVLLRVCFTVIALTPFARALYMHRYPQLAGVGGIYVNSFLRLDTLLVGAAVALWLREHSPSAVNVRRAAWAAILIALTTLVASLTIFVKNAAEVSVTNRVTSTVGFTLIAITGAGLLLLAIDPSTRISRWLQYRPLVSLGRISYGLYFFHGLFSNAFFTLSRFLWPHHLAFLVPLAAFAVALTAASLSFRFVESPFLRLKPVLAPRPGAADDPPPILVG